MLVVRARLVANEKERWRRETAEELQQVVRSATAQFSVTTSADAYTWRLDKAAFESATIEVLRRGEDVTAQRMLRKAMEDYVAAAPGSADADDRGVILDRWVALCAHSIELDRPAIARLTIAWMFNLMRWVTTKGTAQELLGVTQRLYGLGALALRAGSLKVMRTVEMGPARPLLLGGIEKTWHRLALTLLSRQGLLVTDAGGQKPLSLFVQGEVLRLDELRMDRSFENSSDPDLVNEILTSICQFDLLNCLASIVEGKAYKFYAASQVCYPSFAQAQPERVHPIIDRVIKDTTFRCDAVGDADDETLAFALQALTAVSQEAARGFDGWTGFDRASRAFIDRNIGDAAQDVFN